MQPSTLLLVEYVQGVFILFKKSWGAICILVVSLVLTFAGCSTKLDTATTRVFPEDSETLASLCKSDLAQKIGTDIKNISVSAVQAMDFSDTSLGLPQLGESYAQIITPGYVILLKANGKVYEYHTSKTNKIVFYKPGQTTNPSASGSGTFVIKPSSGNDTTIIITSATLPSITITTPSDMPTPSIPNTKSKNIDTILITPPPAN